MSLREGERGLREKGEEGWGGGRESEEGGWGGGGREGGEEGREREEGGEGGREGGRGTLKLQTVVGDSPSFVMAAPLSLIL